MQQYILNLPRPIEGTSDSILVILLYVINPLTSPHCLKNLLPIYRHTSRPSHNPHLIMSLERIIEGYVHVETLARTAENITRITCVYVLNKRRLFSNDFTAACLVSNVFLILNPFPAYSFYTCVCVCVFHLRSCSCWTCAPRLFNSSNELGPHNNRSLNYWNLFTCHTHTHTHTKWVGSQFFSL